MLGDERGGPGGEAVQGLPGQQEVAQQHAKHHGGGQVGLRARQPGPVPLEQARQVEQVQDTAAERSSADLDNFAASAGG